MADLTMKITDDEDVKDSTSEITSLKDIENSLNTINANIESLETNLRDISFASSDIHSNVHQVHGSSRINKYTIYGIVISIGIIVMTITYIVMISLCLSLWMHLSIPNVIYISLITLGWCSMFIVSIYLSIFVIQKKSYIYGRLHLKSQQVL